MDSYKFLPRLLKMYYEQVRLEPLEPIPWTPLEGDPSRLTFGLVTSAGIYRDGVDPPFNLDREREEPTWGDPTFRTIPVDVDRDTLRVSHLHYNPQDVLVDLNIVLPLDRFQEWVDEERIGGLAPTAYSFMGFQGYPADLRPWIERYGPEVARRLKAEGASCVLLTPV